VDEKTFLQELYEALEAETHDNTDATRGSDRGPEAFFLATDPPPGGGGENRVQDELTYMILSCLSSHPLEGLARVVRA